LPVNRLCICSYFELTKVCDKFAVNDRLQPCAVTFSAKRRAESISVSRGAKAPLKFLAYLVILCIGRMCPKQTTVAHFKSKDFASQKNLGVQNIWAGYATG